MHARNGFMMLWTEIENWIDVRSGFGTGVPMFAYSL